MSTLQKRLEIAMERAQKTKADLARACDISRAAVSKWFEKEAKNLKMEHLFAVADECNVEPRWLAIGQGSMERNKAAMCEHGDIPKRRIDLIRMYGRLPDDVRLPIRALIETLGYVNHEHRNEYVANVEAAKAKRQVHDKAKA